MNTNFDPQPLVLEGRHARLEPLSPEHAPDLTVAAQDESIWLYLPWGPLKTLDDTKAWIEETHRRADGGGEVPFAIIHLQSGRAVGSTRYLDIQRPNRGLEIGGTWIGKDFRRTAVNTECKYMLFKHAFETHGAIRVQLKTDARNIRSQTAIERIGAKREGALRNHMILPNGYLRDSVYFSVIASEWPEVKNHLEARLQS